jgi:hypothetical protein
MRGGTDRDMLYILSIIHGQVYIEMYNIFMYKYLTFFKSQSPGLLFPKASTPLGLKGWVQHPHLQFLQIHP